MNHTLLYRIIENDDEIIVITEQGVVCIHPMGSEPETDRVATSEYYQIQIKLSDYHAFLREEDDEDVTVWDYLNDAEMTYHDWSHSDYSAKAATQDAFEWFESMIRLNDGERIVWQADNTLFSEIEFISFDE